MGGEEVGGEKEHDDGGWRGGERALLIRNLWLNYQTHCWDTIDQNLIYRV